MKITTEQGDQEWPNAMDAQFQSEPTRVAIWLAETSAIYIPWERVIALAVDTTA